MKKKKPAPRMYEKVDKPKVYPSFAKTPRPKDFKPINPVVNEVCVRETTKYKSLTTSGLTGGIPVDRIFSVTYTGEMVQGVSLMHKSCYQPVFSEEEARSHATMRR